MPKATSLVQLILKKWGDDIAGAAKELKEMVGFPEPVANRIASGELPMDEASRLKRAQEQGYGEELYHGSTHDITEFNGQGNPGNDWGEGTYLTDDVWDASTNYAGEGPDLTNRIESTAERIADDLHSSWSHASEFWDHLPGGGGGKLADEIDALAEAGKYDEAAMMAARAITKGGNEGVIYPVRVKQDGLLNVKDEVELPDYKAQAADDLGYDYQKYVEEDYDEDVLYEIEELADELQWDDHDSPNANLFGVGNDLDADMSQVESIYEGDTWQDVRDKLGGAVVETPDGEYIGSGGVAGQVMARGGATGVVDDFAPSRFPSMGAGHHTIMFPGSENQIRSVNAAYDPQYTGPNIMGGAALPVAAGLLAAGRSDDSEAGFVTKGGKTLLEAFHGSPHKFDKFLMDQIGTGEGAQAYGHGLYFTDTEDIARGYRDQLAGSDGYYNGRRIADMGLPTESPEVRALSHASSLLEDGYTDDVRADTLKYFQDDLDEWLGYKADFKDDPEILKNIEDEIVGRKGALDAAMGIDYDALKVNPNGHIYRTEIDVTPESLLDWDKPLSEQSEGVRGAIGDLAKQAESDAVSPSLLSKRVTGSDGVSRYADLRELDKIDGSSAHEILESIYGTSASEQLNNRGIKGIKYLDGDSRAVGDGTSNYVIFDDSLINITERGNADPRLLAGIAGTTAAGLAAPMIKDSGMISSPRSETLFDLTMGARDVERRLEGSPASLLFPSGLVEYLETVNRREEDPNAMTRGMALLDVLPW